MKPLQVGDLVRCYGWSRGHYARGVKGKVVKVSFFGTVPDSVEIDLNGYTNEERLAGTNTFYFHPKACRRLKPRKPKERMWTIYEIRQEALRLTVENGYPGQAYSDLLLRLEARKP